MQNLYAILVYVKQLNQANKFCEASRKNYPIMMCINTIFCDFKIHDH